MGAVVLVRIMRMVSVRWCFETLVSTEILVQMVQTRWPVHYFRFRELNRYGESFFGEALEVIFLCGIMRLLTCCCVRVHSKDRVTVTSGRMFRYIGHIVRRRYFPGYRLTSNTILYFAGKPGRSRRRSVRHVEERFRIADEFVHVSFSRYLLHYTLLVVVPQRSAQFVVIHRRSILLNTPSTSHLELKKERKNITLLIISENIFVVVTILYIYIYLFRFDELELHPTTGPRDARCVRWIVQQSNQKLPQLQRTSTLLLIPDRHLAPR